MNPAISLCTQVLALFLAGLSAISSTAHAACRDQYFAPEDHDNRRPLKRPHPDFSGMLQKADAGDALASRSLAASYEAGYLVSKCQEKAARWYERAARAGDRVAKRWMEEHVELAKMSTGPECTGKYCSDTTQVQADAATVYSGHKGHYFAPLTINGVTVSAMIDTGASEIAMSREMAQKLGIDGLQAEEGVSVTANGDVQVSRVTVPLVTVSGITLDNVRVSIGIRNGPLIGMSFLGRLRMKMNGGVLTLSH